MRRFFQGQHTLIKVSSDQIIDNFYFQMNHLECYRRTVDGLEISNGLRFLINIEFIPTNNFRYKTIFIVKCIIFTYILLLNINFEFFWKTY